MVNGQFNSTIPSTQPEYGNWNVHYSPFDVNGEEHQNHVFRFGWNCAAGGGAQIAGWGAFCQEHESHYRPGGPLDPREWFEWHLAAYSYGGLVSRPLSVMADKVTGNVTTNIQAYNLNFLDPAGNVNLQMYAGLFILQNHAAIRSVDNNVAVLQQYNAAGNVAVPLIELDTTDTVVIGKGSYPARTGPLEVAGTLYLKDGSVKEVTWGKPNSCGEGFKCIRIPN